MTAGPLGNGWTQTYDRPVVDSARRRGLQAARGARRGSRVGDRARVLLALIRITNGALGLGAPAFLARSSGGDPEHSAPSHYPFRLFGVRTVIIGLELLSRNEDRRDYAVRVALPIHLTDTVSAALGGLLGDTPPKEARRLTAISAANTVLSLLARRTLR
jgi:hypothetical protein